MMYHTLQTKTQDKINSKRAMFSIHRVNIEPELEQNKQMMTTLTSSIDGTLTTPSQENIPKCPHRPQAN